MGITGFVCLEDRVTFSYHLKKPWGEPDKFGTEEIDYSSIASLPVFLGLPESIDSRDYYWEERIHIPKINKTLIFVFNSYPEKNVGPEEETIKGTYREN